MDSLISVSPVAKIAATAPGFINTQDKYKSKSAIVGEALGQLAMPALIRTSRDLGKFANPFGDEPVPRTPQSIWQGLAQNIPLVPDHWKGEPQMSGKSFRKYDKVDEALKFLGVNVKSIPNEAIDDFAAKQQNEIKTIAKIKEHASDAKNGDEEAILKLSKMVPRSWNAANYKSARIDGKEVIYPDPDETMRLADQMARRIEAALKGSEESRINSGRQRIEDDAEDEYEPPALKRISRLLKKL